MDLIRVRPSGYPICILSQFRGLFMSPIQRWSAVGNPSCIGLDPLEFPALGSFFSSPPRQYIGGACSLGSSDPCSTVQYALQKDTLAVFVFYLTHYGPSLHHSVYVSGRVSRSHTGRKSGRAVLFFVSSSLPFPSAVLVLACHREKKLLPSFKLKSFFFCHDMVSVQ